jgi:hypothetical protein
MGTPHRGSTKETYGEILTKIVKVALRQPNDQLLRTLRPDSHILENQRENQREQFTTISSRMSIVCIKELVRTAIGLVRFFLFLSYPRLRHVFSDPSL